MQIHKESLLIYEDIQRSEQAVFNHKIKISFKFDYSPNITINFGDFSDEPYRIVMMDRGSNQVIYESQLSTGLFCMAYRRWISDLDILVYNSSGYLVKTFNLFKILKTGKVIIAVESSSLGDTLAWVPYIKKFVERHNCSDANITTFWNHIFHEESQNIKFRHPGWRDSDYDVLIGVGWYDENDRNYHPKDPRTCNLQEVAADILGVDYSGDIRPILNFKPDKPPTDEKYICIAPAATSGFKLWQRHDGWKDLCFALSQRGYKIYNLSKENWEIPGAVNIPPSDINVPMNYIYHSEFVIGLGSGLSWLSWAMYKHVVMIANFSDPITEFQTGITRIVNKSVCNSCWNNTDYRFDRSWLWCPIHKDTDRHFECSKEISPEMVMEKIEHLLS